MKKKLLFILMTVMCTLGMHATSTTTDLDVSSLPLGNSAQYNSTTGVLTLPKSKGRLNGLGATYSSGEIHTIIIQTEDDLPSDLVFYVEGGAYTNSGQGTDYAITSGVKTATISLSHTYSAISLVNRSSSAQEIKIVSIKRIVRNVVESGDPVALAVYGNSGNGKEISSSSDLTLEAAHFAEANLNDVIRLTISRTASNGTISFQIKDGDDNPLSIEEKMSKGDAQIYYYAMSDASTLAAIKTSGIKIVYGTAFSTKSSFVNKVELLSTDESEAGNVENLTVLELTGGGNWRGSNAESGYFTSGYTYGKVQFDSNTLNGKWNGIGGSGWATAFGTNKTHRFTLRLNEYAPQAGFYFYILSKEDWGNNNNYVIKRFEIPTDKKVITIDVNEEEIAPDNNKYAAVFIINLGSASGNATSTLDIASITRAEISGSSAPAINAPTITPVSGNYTGNVSVTITKGEGNDKVVYSISGAASGNVTDAEFTAAELNAGSKTIDLTGTADITVTATGYVGIDASAAVTNTYTFVVNAPTVSPASGTYDGELSVTITPGVDNDKVIYTVSGSNEDAANVEISSATVLNLTGSSNITVTATGYKGAVASTVVTNTYTYDSNIPSGVITVWSGSKSFGGGWSEDLSIDKSKFSDIEVGDYVYLYATHDGAVSDIGFRSNRNGYDEAPWYGFTNADGYTSGGNGAHGSMTADETYWWLKVGVENGTVKANVYNGDQNTDIALDAPYYFKNYNTVIQGLNFTLTGVEIHKAKSISENSDNSITKYTDMIVNLERSFVKDMWNTVCLPFVPTAEQANNLFGAGYKLAAFTGVNGTTMEFSTINISGFEAGKPYLVKPTQDLSSAVTLFDVDLTATNGKTVTFGDYSFKGTLVTKSFDSSEWSSIRFVGANNKLLIPNDNTSMKALRCYFVVPPVVNAARSFTIDGMDDDDSTTNISSMGREATTTNHIYDLSGRQVVNPAKGLYIVNGRKVVIR